MAREIIRLAADSASTAQGNLTDAHPRPDTVKQAAHDLRQPIAAVLALIAIPAVAMNWKSARLLVWIFSVEGTLDLMAAIALATIYGAHAFMGPAYWIPAFWVPALLVTHYITFVVLLKYWKEAAQPGGADFEL